MRQYSVTVGGQKRIIGLDALPEGGAVRLVVDGQERHLEIRRVAGMLSWLDGTRVVNVEVQPAPGPAGAAATASQAKLAVSTAGHTLLVEVADVVVETAAALQAQGRTGSGPLLLRAPMPGRVVKLSAKVGDQVKAGQGVVVVEAMKMENELRAGRDGRVREIKVSEGATVEAGEELVVIE